MARTTRTVASSEKRASACSRSASGVSPWKVTKDTPSASNLRAVARKVSRYSVKTTTFSPASCALRRRLNASSFESRPGSIFSAACRRLRASRASSGASGGGGVSAAAPGSIISSSGSEASVSTHGTRAFSSSGAGVKWSRLRSVARSAATEEPKRFRYTVAKKWQPLALARAPLPSYRASSEDSHAR